MTGPDDDGTVVPFPARNPGYIAPTHDDAARWLFTYAEQIRERPNDEGETIILLQQECERVDYIDGDWVHGVIAICQALLANKREP